MSIRFGIVLILLSLVTSCAQIEVLSGGATDNVAPQPDLEKMTPKNGSTNFQGQELIIPFDEFISLNNPVENIVVIPPDIKPKAKIKNKSLIISWDDALQPNTTYAFYLNGVVQDVSEKNDSLMSFVFSTGSAIDSLFAEFSVVDAFTKNTLPGKTVGLYSQYSDTVLPDYFGKTDANGRVRLSYLKSGKYQMVTFDDKNKDLKPQKNEAFGFRMDEFVLNDSLVDTIPVLLSPPAEDPKITSLTLKAPNTILVAANRSLEKSRFLLNGQLLSDENALFFDRDSVLLPFLPNDSASYELIVQSENWTDTSSIRLMTNDRKAPLKLNLVNTGDLFANESIRLYSHHVISTLNVSQIVLINKTDNSPVPIRRIQFREMNIDLDFDRKENINTVQLLFLPKAIETASGPNTDTLRFDFVCLSPKDVGVLKVNLEGFDQALILQLISKGKMLESVPLTADTKQYAFSNLLSGEYSFVVIVDENNNGIWDGGEFSSKTPPEKVYLFAKSQRVRGNWDTEVTLKLEEDGN